jgi:hypothetical protein
MIQIYNGEIKMQGNGDPVIFQEKVVLCTDHLAALAEKDKEISSLKSAMNIFGEDPCWTEILVEKCAEIASLTTKNNQLRSLVDGMTEIAEIHGYRDWLDQATKLLKQKPAG